MKCDLQVVDQIYISTLWLTLDSEQLETDIRAQPKKVISWDSCSLGLMVIYGNTDTMSSVGTWSMHKPAYDKGAQ